MLATTQRKARLIAFYLPQFHPIPENDSWWGPGFTEWRNVAQAKPLFRGHYQPHVPADLGFYDLRVPDVREAQARMARDAGIEGFCYWHYWFAGRRLLELPFNQVLRLGEPRLPFCLGWANQTWTGIWHGAPNRVLIEQTYPRRADHEQHFHTLLEAFHDPRYIRVRGKPLFLIYRPGELTEAAQYIEQWQTLAHRNGLPGIHFVAHVWFNDTTDYRSRGFEGIVFQELSRASSQTALNRARRLVYPGSVTESEELSLSPRVLCKAVQLIAQKYLKARLSLPNVIRYSEAMLYFLDRAATHPYAYPCVIPNWDNSPRSGRSALILHDSQPELFRQHLNAAIALVQDRPFDESIVFVKSWNEWAEGNYLEPDLRHGHAYLQAVRAEVLKPCIHQAAPPPNLTPIS